MITQSQSISYVNTHTSVNTHTEKDIESEAHNSRYECLRAAGRESADPTTKFSLTQSSVDYRRVQPSGVTQRHWIFRHNNTVIVTKYNLIFFGREKWV